MEFQLISPQTFVEAIKFNYDDLHNWITEQTESITTLFILMILENQIMLMSIWENLHRIADNCNFFVKNSEMDAIAGACEALRPLIYKIQEEK